MVIIMMCSMLTMEFVPKIPYWWVKLLPSSLLAILVSILIEYAIVRNLTGCTDAGGDHRRLASASNATSSSDACKTEVIGDVTPFSFTYPEPFIFNDEYKVNGTYAISGSDTGQVIVQGALLAIAGVVQGLMTTEVVTSFVKTPAHTPSIVWSMGAANLISGFLGGMGGDAMIGLSTLNCLSGGRGRLAPTVTALGVMLCTMVAYPVLDYIPISALAGVMIVVVLHTFKWAKIPMVISAVLPASWRAPINQTCCCAGLPKWMQLPEEVDRWEAAILVAVSALTVAFNLVVGVAVGVVMAAVRYAYSASLVTDVRVVPTKPGEPKRYILIGELFFGSSMRFHDFFDVENDPEQVVLQMEKKVTEYSATDALQRVEMLYAEVSKTFTVEYVSRTGEVTSSTNTRTAAAAAAANASGATAAVAIEMETAGGA